MATERFEMRIDSGLLDRLDQWRQGEDDKPSRAEAVRRLIEAGVAHDDKGRVPHLSDGERLIAAMLAEFIEKSGVKVGMNVDLVHKIIYGGHYWAFGWEMPGLFHGYAAKQRDVHFVVDVLDMWTFIEEAYEKLSSKEKARLAEEADPFGKHVKFEGFDGTNEAEHRAIARFMIDELNRFSRFREGHRDLNSHYPAVAMNKRMLEAFEPMRKTLVGRHLTVNELVELLNRRRAE